MPTFNIVPRRLGVLAACLIASSVPVLAKPVLAKDGQAIADLLETPAPQRDGARARNGLLLAVARAERRLVAVGERGTILLSDDGGRQWRQARSVPVSVALTGVSFADGRHGWAVGHSGVVLHSADGGETWARQLDGRAMGALALEEAQARAAAGEDAARALRDAAALSAEGPDKPLLAVHFADARRGWAVGAYGLALATVDGGRRWTSIMGRIPNTGGRHLYSVAPVRDGLVIAGEQGSLFRSGDGGASFEAVKTPYAGTFFGAADVGGGHLLAYGLRGNAWRGGADGGWERIDLGPAATLIDAAPLADGRLLLIDEGGRLFLGGGDSGGTAFAALAQAPAAGLSGLVHAGESAIVVVGLHGAQRLDLPSSAVEIPK